HRRRSFIDRLNDESGGNFRHIGVWTKVIARSSDGFSSLSFYPLRLSFKNRSWGESGMERDQKQVSTAPQTRRPCRHRPPIVPAAWTAAANDMRPQPAMPPDRLNSSSRGASHRGKEARH